MKEIKLSQQGKNKGKYVALVDDEDYEHLNQFRWSVVKAKKTYYAISYCVVNGKRGHVLMHRIILNTPKGLEVDHNDHNGLNNQKYNIKNCTHQINMQNVRRSGVYKRKHRGVMYIHKNIGCRKYVTKSGEKREYYSKPMYVVHLKIDGKLKDFGRFKTEQEALIHLESLKLINIL